MKDGLLIGDFLFVSKYTYGYSRHSFPFSIPVLSERVLADRTPQLGEVIVFRGTRDTDKDYIKRVIGGPGDKIQMRDGYLYINGEQATLEPAGTWHDDLWFKRSGGREVRMSGENQQRKVARYIETLPNGVQHSIIKMQEFGVAPFDNTPVFTVPEGHYFVMGDNRDESGDSRAMIFSAQREPEVSFVPQENIIGKAQIIWLSVNARWWAVWEWFTGIRFDRFFKGIQ